MPIRFRCVYCNQLLGISRRKAGTIVRCTSCEGQLIVPEPSDAATEAGQAEKPPAPPPSPKVQAAEPDRGVGVFDAAEFDAFLEPLNGGGGGGPAVAKPPAPSARRSPSASGVVTVTAADTVLSLTRRGVTIAAAAAVLALGLAFAAGLLVGMALR
ncbi:MAG TPA: hypothetical protein VH120_04165 [Gemmataceae bacterium]|jgi:hypothetical protein|nr:hypothetical protein [Gemmataceae bacterium]